MLIILNGDLTDDYCEREKNYSFEEYLEWEETASYKHEYQAGEIVPMAGETMNHNIITLNFAAYLKFALKGQDKLRLS